MTARRAYRLLACLLSLATLAPYARAQGAEPAADLGKPAITGQGASDGIRARAARLHLAMACGNEFDFAQRFALESRSFKHSHTPDFNLDNWPVTLMVGKAARLIDQSRERAPCESTLHGKILDDWGSLTQEGRAAPGETPVELVNRVYKELYDDKFPRSERGAACESVAHLGENFHVILSLSDACLARQIRVVMTDPGHGPWKWENGVVVPELPGTSASKLPCLSKFELPGALKGVIDGDWDQAVIEYTRLASLLYRYRQSTTAIRADVGAAVDALNRRFLTLRSSPEQGATARELFSIVASCGNLPNQFGDAIDTVNGSGADPGADRYSKAANDALGKSSFWKKLLHFFKALAILVAIALGAALVGALAAGIVGAITGVGAGVVAVAVGAAVLIALAGGSIEETENHLLMQNTSRYLKNKLMMAELSAQGNREAFDIIADLNEDVRNWLLEHMQQIAREDFVEYNAKPYNRLSHASILNLLDYACDVSWDYESSPIIVNSDRACDDKDRAIVTAAAAVLDLSAAKLAVGSLEGRRLIPYRRLAEENSQFYNGRSILELIGGADNQLAALQIWTGQMRHAPDVDPNLEKDCPDCKASPSTFDQLEWYSTSQYRPDPMILDMAVNKTVAREQQYRHHTRERYVSGNGWLITAGGTDEGPAQGFSSGLGFTLYIPINSDVKNDRGVGVPTTLMTGAQIAGHGRARVQEFLRFDGNKKNWGFNDGKPMWSFSDNNCVAGSFACGLRLQMPSDFDQATCHTRDITSEFFVVDSTRCPAFSDSDSSPANAIFIAIFQNPKGWGFFEVAQQDAYRRSVDAFADAIMAKNKGRFADWDSAGSSSTVEYFAVTQNRLLKFTPKNEDFGADRRACGVVNHESGARFTISNVPAAQAGACRSVGPRIFIDLNDAKNPIRRGEGGLALEQFDHH